ncbi:hypothetical protein VNO78_10952 [Psophocarpus tetragonolobus]|uniref:Uncharacterized protein n=1 Tax=Psophocarpus tetragonolobus TaxID=3891 RepID=A0AAN9SS81_PSOTE
MTIFMALIIEFSLAVASQMAMTLLATKVAFSGNNLLCRRMETMDPTGRMEIMAAEMVVVVVVEILIGRGISLLIETNSFAAVQPFQLLFKIIIVIVV